MTTTTRLSALTGDYVLDKTRTRIGFLAQQVMVTTVRGQFDEFDGHAHLDGESPSESSAQLTIQAKHPDPQRAARRAPARPFPRRPELHDPELYLDGGRAGQRDQLHNHW